MASFQYGKHLGGACCQEANMTWEMDIPKRSQKLSQTITHQVYWIFIYTKKQQIRNLIVAKHIKKTLVTP